MTHSAQKLVARILTGFEQSTKRGRCCGTGCIADATRLHAVMHRVDRLLVLLGFIHGLLFWDGDILLAYGLVGLICWRLVRDAPSVKSLFNTGVMLYLVGLGVLLLLGLISDSQTSRAWTPDASAILYEKYWKLHGGVDAISNRADGVGNSLLALGAQYGWQLAGMMLIGAALMRSGWLKGQFSLRHYRRTGFVLVAIGVTINLPAIALQWQLDWA